MTLKNHINANLFQKLKNINNTFSLARKTLHKKKFEEMPSEKYWLI